LYARSIIGENLHSIASHIGKWRKRDTRAAYGDATARYNFYQTGTLSLRANELDDRN
jgi:hypothetical protein